MTPDPYDARTYTSFITRLRAGYLTGAQSEFLDRIDREGFEHRLDIVHLHKMIADILGDWFDLPAHRPEPVCLRYLYIEFSEFDFITE